MYNQGKSEAEVEQVGVAAELGADARRGRAREVGGHDAGAAAVERERGLRHAAVADGHQLRQAIPIGLFEHVDGVAPSSAIAIWY